MDRLEISNQSMILIYKVFRKQEWESAFEAGCFAGSEADLQDGFIHFSTREQLSGTLQKHFSGEQNLVVAGVDPAGLGDLLRWEPSRKGELFPHLYGVLQMEQVVAIERINSERAASDV